MVHLFIDPDKLAHTYIGSNIKKKIKFNEFCNSDSGHKKDHFAENCTKKLLSFEKLCEFSLNTCLFRARVVFLASPTL